MESLGAALVPPEQHMIHHAGIERPLLAQPRRIIFVAHHRFEHVELGMGTLDRLLVRRRLFHQVDLPGPGFADNVAGQQLRDHHAAATAVETGDRDARKDRPHARQHLVVAPFRLGGIAEHPRRPVGRHHALVRSPGVEQRAIAQFHHLGQRILVQDRQMVEIEIAVIGDLPVRAPQAAAGKQVPVLEVEQVEQAVIARQERIDVDRRVRIDTAEDQAGALGDRQRGQSVAGFVDRAEITR
ncbi:MAG: hypothetical protein DCF31_05480 [Alphaproteobacteria bacterium]|nr:MAG: hypothetical protein DCF31_05480 [Alphaproteobacteria bacterium]